MFQKYLLHQPKTLECMALKKLGEWIASHGEKISSTMETLGDIYSTKSEKLLEQQIEIIRNHIERILPGRIHDKAMAELQQTLRARIEKLRSEEFLRTILKRMIETLFTRHVTSISFETIFSDSICSKYYLLPGLTHIRNLHWRDLSFVGEKFKFIETLELYSSSDDKEIINKVIKLRHLRNINLSDTRLGDTEIGILLMSFPNIEHIIVTKIDLKQVLANIMYVEGDDGRRFNLKSYTNNEHTTFEHQKLVFKMCPSIEKIKLTIYENVNYQNPANHVNTLQDLQNLRELQIIGCTFVQNTRIRFYTDEVIELLRVRGSNLVYLCLKVYAEIDLSAFGHICQMCPNLQSLELESTLQNEYLEDATEEVEIPPLIHLKKISLTDRTGSLLCSAAVLLLSICPNIEYIDISDMYIPDEDDFILEILEKNPTKLMYLRELRVTYNLSKSTIDQIVQNCVNNPEIKAEIM